MDKEAIGVKVMWAIRMIKMETKIRGTATIIVQTIKRRKMANQLRNNGPTSLEKLIITMGKLEVKLEAETPPIYQQIIITQRIMELTQEEKILLCRSKNKRLLFKLCNNRYIRSLMKTIC